MDYIKEVVNSLEYIENNLFDGELNKNIFKVVYISKYHFQRIFSITTNHTLGSYIKKRRLTIIAKRLRNTNDKIVDIALECGYESHEAFSRAFKDYFQQSPRSFRQSLSYNKLLLLEPIDKTLLHIMGNAYDLVPEFIKINELIFYGQRFTTSIDNTSISDKFIHLFDTFEQNKLKTSDKYAYLLWEKCITNVRGLDNSESYLAFVGVTELKGKKEDLDVLVLKDTTYAAFKLINNFNYIYDVYRFIYFRWLYKNSFKLSNKPIVEKYSSDFSIINHTGCMWIMIPVEKEH